MKINLFTLGVCSLLLFSCNKNNKIEETVKNSDSTIITPPEKDVTPAEEIKEDAPKTEKYILIAESKDAPGTINEADIKKIPESLKAIAALYSGLGGSNCEGENCELTTALGLGKQGSQAQKDLVKKWFGKDKAAEQLIAQDFYQPPSSASSFSNFQYLNFEQNGDTVTVDYSLSVYNHGSTTDIKGPDKFIIKGNTIETINRNIWKDTK
ncbi:hypothetical protein [Chryseobacterium sp. MMS23-Vi53]|uniref:hypothetical protein n=1 Tax=Chryseobacterium sp. MMS23-Vi53 TaxID=3386644 RepID=UPI0039E8203A